MNARRAGLLSAVAAYCLWRVLPIFWKLLGFLPAPDIVAQRTIWALAFLFPLLMLRHKLADFRACFASKAAIGWLVLSGTLLAGNWVIYVWATLHDRIIEGALGYYLGPFFNILFGRIFFAERLNRRQLIATGIAAAGVVLQFSALSSVPWVALALGCTFALYAVVKKRAQHGSLEGLTAETTLLAPLALVWLAWSHPSLPSAFGHSPMHTLIVITAGLATALPLLFFGHAARSLRLGTLGILQFIGPTLQLLIGWLIYGEAFGPLRVASFSLIWLAVLLYAHDASRKQPAAVGA